MATCVGGTATTAWPRQAAAGRLAWPAVEVSGGVPGSRGRIGALDGLRAWSILAVLAFHQPFRSFAGGFLGVSTFFTLSGFLITRLIVDDLTRGRFSLAGFYWRRARRLLPAAYVTITVTALSWLGRETALRPAETASALFYVQNWYLRAVDSGYRVGDSPSPLQHLWSLAIEEQFYLVFPLVVVAAWRLGRRRGVAVGCAALAAASFAIGLGARGAGLRSDVYYSTFTRVGELLVGATLAVMVSRGAPLTARTTRALRWAGPAAMAWLVALAVATTLESSWLFPWGVGANAVLSAVVIRAALVEGPLARLLERRPLPLLGRVSYALYLVHWPVFLVIDADTIGVDGPVLFALRVGVSLAGAWLLHRLVEEPVRVGASLRGWRFAPVLSVAALVALIVPGWAGGSASADVIDRGAIAEANELVLRRPSGPPPIDADGPVPASVIEPARTQASVADLAARPDAVPSVVPGPGTTSPIPAALDGPATTPVPPADPAATVPEYVATPPQHVLFLGDSTAWTLSRGPAELAVSEGWSVNSFVAVGCGLGGSVPIRYLGAPEEVDPTCDRWISEVGDVFAFHAPEVVIVSIALADLSERNVDGEWRHIGDPVYDAWFAERLDRFATVLDAECTTVRWLLAPHFDLGSYERRHGVSGLSEAEPARVDRLNDLLHDMVDRHPSIELIDFSGQLQTLPGGEFDAETRPDGVHVDTSQSMPMRDWIMRVITAPRPQRSCPA